MSAMTTSTADGSAMASRTQLRTDSHKADTDGDGKNDNVDSCPTIAAATDEVARCRS
jgi:hypothetical protein